MIDAGDRSKKSTGSLLINKRVHWQKGYKLSPQIVVALEMFFKPLRAVMK